MDPEFSTQQRPSVEKRWKSYEPWCAIESRKHPDPAARLYELKQLHAKRLHTLFARKIDWTVIRRYQLDCPTMTDAGFDVALAAAVERRRARLGRAKGKSKKYHTKHQEMRIC